MSSKHNCLLTTFTNCQSVVCSLPSSVCTHLRWRGQILLWIHARKRQIHVMMTMTNDNNNNRLVWQPHTHLAMKYEWHKDVFLVCLQHDMTHRHAGCCHGLTQNTATPLTLALLRQYPIPNTQHDVTHRYAGCCHGLTQNTATPLTLTLLRQYPISIPRFALRYLHTVHCYNL